MRMLEIGPGYNGERIEGFETLDFEKRNNVDHVYDASKPLPFDDETFDIIYASHVLEHIHYRDSLASIREWVRILKTGGHLEVWIPDALKICKAFVLAEQGDKSLIRQNKRLWKETDNDPGLWLNCRVFSVTGRQHGVGGDHSALFSESYLKRLMISAGVSRTEKMSRKEVRGRDYGWVNLGVRGIK